MYALPDFPEPHLTEETFKMTLDGRIRISNGPMVVGQLLANEDNGAQVWDLIKSNWDCLIDLFPPMILKRALETIWTRHDQGIWRSSGKRQAASPSPSGRREGARGRVENSHQF